MPNIARQLQPSGGQFLVQTSRASISKTFFMYNNKIEKREIASNFYGVFASKDIAKEEIIFKNWNDSCALRTRAEVDAMPEPYKTTFEKYCTELTPHSYVGPYENEDISDQFDYFVNHCCDPNVWMINDGDVAARNAIKAGEQITIDYATFVVHEFESARIDPCLCGSVKCRGKIGKDDWWQMRHVYSGHYISWIETKITKREKGIKSNYKDDSPKASSKF